MKFRVYSQYYASGDVRDIEDFYDEESAMREFNKRVLDEKTMYHCVLEVLNEKEATAYWGW